MYLRSKAGHSNAVFHKTDRFSKHVFFIPPEQRSCWGGVLVSLHPPVCQSVRPSICPSVCPSGLLCLLCNIYSSGWILSILATNDHYHERVCHTQWPLTLTYIFKVIRPWLRKSCPLCSVYISGWILFLFATIIISIRGCVACNDLWPCPIFSRSFGLDLENRVRSVTSIVLDRFSPYLIQMITSMRMCVACDDLWPWPVSSGSFDLDFENCVRSVTFSVLVRLFPYLPQIITTNRGCVAC